TGGGLAVAGTLFQGVFRNPLADPYLIGTASGAGFGAVLVFTLGASFPPLALLGAPLVAFVFALLTVLLVAALASDVGGVPTVRLILAGVVVSAVFTAATSFLLVAAREQSAGILSRLLGGFGLASWGDVLALAAFTAPAVALAVALARALDLFQLGERGAALLGLPVESVKLLLLGVASLVTAACVSVAGIIGFVGLMVPHAARLLTGPAHARLLPVAALWRAGRRARAARVPVVGQGAPAAAGGGGGGGGRGGGGGAAAGAPRRGDAGGRALEAVDVAARYAATYGNGPAALDGVTLRVEPGAVVGLIGPNGAGKSTLLRLFTRQLAPASGRVLLDGRELERFGRFELARRVALVSQEPEVPVGFTVAETVAMGRAPHVGLLGAPGPEDERVVAAALAATGMLPLAGRRVETLSGGE